MSHTYESIGMKADLVRDIDLKAVLEKLGCVQDKSDKAKWHTCQGVISVTGQKFMNWSQGIGGGGSIDLVVHLMSCDFKTAVIWLSEAFHCMAVRPSEPIKPSQKVQLRLPVRDDKKLSRVTSYLIQDRCIPFELIHHLVLSGKIYADTRGNAVFLLLGKEKRAVGAELRGTSKRRWRGTSSGSRKDLGCFYVKLTNKTKIIICESAIDALSCFALYPDAITMSTSGATSNPPWLPKMIDYGFDVYCGFDSDNAGDDASKRMIITYPTVKRIRPIKHDWNEVLKHTQKSHAQSIYRIKTSHP